MKQNGWQARFGAKRRTIDRAILAKLEKKSQAEKATMRENIRKAFGRKSR